MNGQTTSFTMDLNTGLTQALSDGTYTYLYGVDRIAQVDATSDYYLNDTLGSVRQMTDDTGAITYARSYDPYGVVAQTGGASQTVYGYTGEFQDSYIKLIYLRSRWYDPASGRFNTKDSWQGDYNRPLSLNRWLYVEGNPINLTDPNGHDPYWCDYYKDEQKRTQCWVDYITSLGQMVGSSQVPPTPTCTPTVIPTPTSTMSGIPLGNFFITHYVIPDASDPIYQNCSNCYKGNIPIWTGSGPGFIDGNIAFFWGILDTENSKDSDAYWGVMQEGTGYINGTFVSADFNPSHLYPDFSVTFDIGKGGACRDYGYGLEEGKTVAADLSQYPCGTKFTIDAYPGTIFQVTDTGGDIKGNHLDIFVGKMFKKDFDNTWGKQTAFLSGVTLIQ